MFDSATPGNRVPFKIWRIEELGNTPAVSASVAIYWLGHRTTLGCGNHCLRNLRVLRHL